MPILRIRENFTTTHHPFNSILNFEEKWRSKLIYTLGSQTEFVLSCKKLSDEVNCIYFHKNGEEIHLETSYLIGLDYIQEEVPFMVEPKFSYGNNDYSIDFYKILFESLPYVKSSEIISDLYEVKFDSKPIEIEQKDDFLTPILVIQYLNILKKICSSGLQKGYYLVEQNLNSKVKGKILIKETIKHNHLKANYSDSYCRYQQFGYNTKENQFLKYAFQFCLNYLNQFRQLDLFQSIENMVGMIRSSFLAVDYNEGFRKEMVIRKNPMFPEYESAIRLANMILKRNAFNITNTTTNKVKTYPYWINMSKLFELHVIKLLREGLGNMNQVIFQKSFGHGKGRIPDIILNYSNLKAVIDVKYKDYSDSIAIEDIRQVAAYSRMKGIFKELKLNSADVLDAIIIYPKVESNNKILNKSVINKREELSDYFNIYKLEVDIPILTKTN